MISSTRERYETYLSALAQPIENEGGELAEKMEAIRKSLFDLPDSVPESDITEAYRGKIPQIQLVLVKWYGSVKKSPLYDDLPETPEGMGFLSEMAKASECYKYFSLFEVLKHCILQRDFALAIRFVEENAKEKNRDNLYAFLIEAKFRFDESTASLPVEFKELLSKIIDDKIHDNILGDLAIPYRTKTIFLQNPPVLKELAALYRNEDTEKTLSEIAARMEEEMKSSWCFLW